MIIRKFRTFLRDHQKRVSGKNKRNVLKEETDDSEITDAAMLIIGSEISGSERKSDFDGFVSDIKKMRDRGRSIVAIALALE
jgi:hypothetical protein